MINSRTFPVDTASPYAVKRMAEFLQGGGKLVLFSEGRISLTGTLGKIFDGTGFLLNKTKAKAICCYLRGSYRLPLSPNLDHKKWFPRVSAHFSAVLAPPVLETKSVAEKRALLSEWLRDRLIDLQFQTEQNFSPRNVLAAIVETARQQPHHVNVEDTKGQELPHRRLLAGTRLFGQEWKKKTETGQFSDWCSLAQCECDSRDAFEFMVSRKNTGAAQLLERNRLDARLRSFGGNQADHQLPRFSRTHSCRRKTTHGGGAHADMARRHSWPDLKTLPADGALPRSPSVPGMAMREKRSPLTKQP